jgi:hypothetical protein
MSGTLGACMADEDAQAPHAHRFRMVDTLAHTPYPDRAPTADP